MWTRKLSPVTSPLLNSASRTEIHRLRLLGDRSAAFLECSCCNETVNTERKIKHMPYQRVSLGFAQYTDSELSDFYTSVNTGSRGAG